MRDESCPIERIMNNPPNCIICKTNYIEDLVRDARLFKPLFICDQCTKSHSDFIDYCEKRYVKNKEAKDAPPDISEFQRGWTEGWDAAIESMKKTLMGYKR